MAEEKWKANMEKVAFMKQFPGLTGSWEMIQGKTVEAVSPLPSKPGAATLVFTDGSFVVAPPIDAQPHELGESLRTARAYQEYDRLVKKDRDALKAARLEKIVGAIQNNLEQIPELKDRLRKLVNEWK
jgi:diglucosylglycerate octanoyltransferase